ncbi:MAG TPA: winged helix-turn-helix domain-containing protein [Vicinamibacterales bacterium]|nr:winged helix-turn-helix domain-containing protein [Vicinamibacterales bacterium]
MENRFRFGEFEFDVRSGELRRSQSDSAERLPPQPARLLHLLAERGGAIVTREEIRERLWPETHVDFDTSLHFCVRQLRVALGDSGGEPRYVQNVPRRGYRLIPEVTRVENLPVVPPAPAAPSVVPTQAPARRWARVARLAIPLIVAAAVGAFGLSQSRRTTPPVRIAIMPFKASIAEWIVEDLANLGGDSVGVVGPTTTAAYTASELDLRRLAADYRIDYIINGRDIAADSGPVLLAELIRAADGAHVWVRPYKDLTDSRRLGHEISRNVARVLQLRQADAPR